MKTQEQIGKNIKLARKQAGLTQAEVSEKVGIHINYFARVERGEKRPSIETLLKIAKILNVKSSDLLPL